MESINHLPTAKEVIDWYDKFNIREHHIDELMKARQKLSVYCVGIAKQIEHAEVVHKELYQQRRINESMNFLGAEGSVKDREAISIDEDLRMQEAKAEGELRGMRTMLDSYFKVMDAMASQINVMRQV